MNAELTADMSAAPEIAILADATLFVPARPAARPQRDEHTAYGEKTACGEKAQVGGGPSQPPTLGTLARQLRLLSTAGSRTSPK